MLPKGEAPGLAMALGGFGIKLTDLTMLYVGLARGGDAVPLVERATRPDAPAASRRLLDPVAAWYVGNVLSGTPPPENAAGGRIAYKTGTSLWLPRRLVGRLRRPQDHRRLGRPRRTARRCRG